jgi:hypothetical protein
VLLILILAFLVMRLTGFGRKGKSGFIIAGTGNGDPALGAWSEGNIRKAMEYAASGLYRNAISVLFRSALQGLDESGWIRYRKSGASRAYLRQLRKSENLYPLFRDMLYRFEIAYYKNDETFAEDWNQLLGIYQNLAKTAVTGR